MSISRFIRSMVLWFSEVKEMFQIGCQCRNLIPTQGLILWPRLIQFHNFPHSALSMILLKNDRHSYATNYLCPPTARIDLLPRNRRKMLSIEAFGLSLQSSCWGAVNYRQKVPDGFKISQSHYTWTTWVYHQQTRKLPSSHEYILTKADITIMLPFW